MVRTNVKESLIIEVIHFFQLPVANAGENDTMLVTSYRSSFFNYRWNIVSISRDLLHHVITKSLGFLFYTLRFRGCFTKEQTAAEVNYLTSSIPWAGVSKSRLPPTRRRT